MFDLNNETRRTLNLMLSKTLVLNEWHYARFSMNGIPNGFGPSGIETKLLTHRYLEQKSYYVTSYYLTKSLCYHVQGHVFTWVPPSPSSANSFIALQVQACKSKNFLHLGSHIDSLDYLCKENLKLDLLGLKYHLPFHFLFWSVLTT